MFLTRLDQLNETTDGLGNVAYPKMIQTTHPCSVLPGSKPRAFNK